MDSARSVDTSPDKQCVRERVYFAVSLPLVAACLRELPLSTFFVSHLFPAPFSDLTVSARGLLSRAKDVCFVNQQSWLKLPLALSQSPRPSCLVKI